MKSFYTIFQSVILLILSSNMFLVVLYGKDFFNMNISSQYLTLALLVVINFILITLLIQKFFYSPLVKLEHTIKKFYVGALKDKDIELNTSLNPHLNNILLFFSKTLSTLKNIKSEFMHGREIKSEVELGKEIQGKMLTKKMIDVPSLDIVMKSKPAGEIGGDSYDIIHEGDNYYIYVGDATGHGVGAGFIMIMVNALISGFAKVYKSGNMVLSKTNDILKPRVKANLLMSLLLLRWDEKEKKIYMTGAGHEYLIIYKQKQKKCFKIKSGGVALGMIKDISKLLKEQQIQFEPNDVIVLYSDGITEAINQSKKDGNEDMFGEDRLMEAIEKAPQKEGETHKNSRDVFNNITIELSKFMGYKHVQLDDITLATIHYTNGLKPITIEDTIKNDFITEWRW